MTPPPTLFLNQLMPFFDQYALSHRLRGPDSETLLLPQVVNRKLRLPRVPLDGSPAQPVAEGVVGLWSWL